MKSLTRILLWISVLQLAAVLPSARGQSKSDQAPSGATGAQTTKELNLQEYIELLRKDVRQQKTEFMGAVMVLSADSAAKFWPIYSEYDAELTKLNNKRVENIKEYARSYDQMTDAKADELIQNALSYQKERDELLAKTYERVKQTLGAVTAARFVQVEHQLLLIIDLQITSSLPIASQASQIPSPWSTDRIGPARGLLVEVQSPHSLMSSPGVSRVLQGLLSPGGRGRWVATPILFQ